MPNYLLKIDLNPINYKTKEKIIRRTLNVPADYTFRELHRAIYIAFQWDDVHCWKFNVKNATEMRTRKQRSNAEDLLEIRHSDRPPRRHRRFDEPPELEADTTTIGTILEDSRYKDKVLEYIWDFGWNWDHVITVQGRPPKDDHITLVKAKGKIPPDVYPFIHPIFTELDRAEIVERLASMNASRGQDGAHTPYQWLGEESDVSDDDDETHQANLRRDRIAQSLVDMDASPVVERAPVGHQQAEYILSRDPNGVEVGLGEEEGGDDGRRRQEEHARDQMTQHLAGADAPRALKRARAEDQQAEEIAGTAGKSQEKRPRVEAE